MPIHHRLAFLLIVALLLPGIFSAQQPLPPPRPEAPGKLKLDVVVTSKSGAPVPGLAQQDFTLLDNKVPQSITSFRAISGRDSPLRVIVLLDAVNSNAQSVAFEREQIDKFLRADAGHLSFPTALAVFTDAGTQFQNAFSTDGNAVSAVLDQDVVGLRSITRASGFYGASERIDLSLEALRQVAAQESSVPGRKIVLWVSPGWALLSGPNVEVGSKEQQMIFSNVVNISTQLRRANITLYSIDPLGAADFGGRSFYYKDFLKGLSKPGQALPGNLALQVFATHTGGLVLNFNNDVAALLRKCVADAESYYEISFDSPPAKQPDEYHQIEIHLAAPGLTARSLEGYYSQPPAP